MKVVLKGLAQAKVLVALAAATEQIIYDPVVPPPKQPPIDPEEPHVCSLRAVLSA